MDIVTPAQVAVTLGQPSPTGTKLAQWADWIDGAYIVIRSRFPDLDVLDQPTLAYVVKEAVADRVKNPDRGRTAREVQVDDGRTVNRYEAASGQISITDAWWDLLTSLDSASGSAAFSISPSYAPDCHGLPPW